MLMSLSSVILIIFTSVLEKVFATLTVSLFIRAICHLLSYIERNSSFMLATVADLWLNNKTKIQRNVFSSVCPYQNRFLGASYCIGANIYYK